MRSILVAGMLGTSPSKLPIISPRESKLSVATPISSSMTRAAGMTSLPPERDANASNLAAASAETPLPVKPVNSPLSSRRITSLRLSSATSSPARRSLRMPTCPIFIVQSATLAARIKEMAKATTSASTSGPEAPTISQPYCQNSRYRAVLNSS